MMTMYGCDENITASANSEYAMPSFDIAFKVEGFGKRIIKVSLVCIKILLELVHFFRN